MGKRSGRGKRGHSEASAELVDFAAKLVVLLNESTFSELSSASMLAFVRDGRRDRGKLT